MHSGGKGMGVWVAGLAAGVPRGRGVWVAVAGAEEPALFGTGPGAKLVSSFVAKLPEGSHHLT